MFCLVLSAVGYAMFGLATSVLFLFIARIPGGKSDYISALVMNGCEGENERVTQTIVLFTN